MVEKTLQLRPQRPLRIQMEKCQTGQFQQQKHQTTFQNINSFYNTYKVNKSNRENIENKIKKEVPEYIILEWELINIIIDYNVMLYTEMEDDEYFSFTSKEIKDYYKKINNAYKKNKRFNRIYGKNGIYMLLVNRNGVRYELKNDTWHIYPKPFLKYMSQIYENDKKNYGNNFDKPWLKNLIKNDI